MPKKPKVTIDTNYEIVSGTSSDTLVGPAGSLERVDRRTETSKHFQIAPARIVGHFFGPGGAIHYKDNYEDKNEFWKNVDPEYHTDEGDHFLYSKLPYLIKVWKNKYGYEIVDKVTGTISSAELVGLDDTPIALASSKLAKTNFKCEINSNGVRFWKETKSGGPKKFKWKILISDNKSNYKFREEPEVFETSDKKKKVKVTTTKDIISGGFNWTEEVPKTGVTIDTDFAHDYYYTFNGYSNVSYAACRTDDSVGSHPNVYVGQSNETDSNFFIHRPYLRYDTSAIGGGSTVNQVNLKLKSWNPVQDNDSDIVIKKNFTNDPASNPTTFWNDVLTDDADDNILGNTATFVDGVFVTSGNLSTAHIDKTGTTQYGLISARDIAATPEGTNETSVVAFYETSVDLVLIIDYTPGVTFMGVGVNEWMGVSCNEFMGA